MVGSYLVYCQQIKFLKRLWKARQLSSAFPRRGFKEIGLSALAVAPVVEVFFLTYCLSPRKYFRILILLTQTWNFSLAVAFTGSCEITSRTGKYSAAITNEVSIFESNISTFTFHSTYCCHHAKLECKKSFIIHLYFTSLSRG